MRIFITGASGVIGRILIPVLVAKGYEVGGMTKSQEKASLLQQLGAIPFVANIFEKEQVQKVFQQFQPDAIIHQVTALSNLNVEENARIRTIGTRHVAEAAKEVNVKRFIAQSIAWAYEPGTTIATEKDSLDVQAIGKRKMTIDGIVALENVVQEMSNAIILRYGALYGPGTWYAPDGMMAQQFISGKAIVNDGMTSFIHIEDAVHATVQALDWKEGIYNIVDDTPVIVRDWGTNYAHHLQAPIPIYQSGKAGWERGASNIKAKLAGGWTLVYPSWKEGFLSE